MIKVSMILHLSVISLALGQIISFDPKTPCPMGQPADSEMIFPYLFDMGQGTC